VLVPLAVQVKPPHHSLVRRRPHRLKAVMAPPPHNPVLVQLKAVMAPPPRNLLLVLVRLKALMVLVRRNIRAVRHSRPWAVQRRPKVLSQLKLLLNNTRRHLPQRAVNILLFLLYLLLLLAEKALVHTKHQRPRSKCTSEDCHQGYAFYSLIIHLCVT
jgi:hypothetical protein